MNSHVTEIIKTLKENNKSIDPKTCRNCIFTIFRNEYFECVLIGGNAYNYEEFWHYSQRADCPLKD